MNKENIDTLTPASSSPQPVEPSNADAAKDAPVEVVASAEVSETAAEESEIQESSLAQGSKANTDGAGSETAVSASENAPIIESPIDLQTLNTPSNVPLRAAADLLQQASLALLQKAGDESGADTAPEKTRFVLRRGKLSEEQIAARKDRLGAIRQRTLKAVRENGAGQALAWLESKSQEDDVALLRETLCAALTIPNEDGSLLRSYSELDSVSAVLFRERLVKSLHGLTIEVE